MQKVTKIEITSRSKDNSEDEILAGVLNKTICIYPRGNSATEAINKLTEPSDSLSHTTQSILMQKVGMIWAKRGLGMKQINQESKLDRSPQPDASCKSFKYSKNWNNLQDKQQVQQETVIAEMSEPKVDFIFENLLFISNVNPPNVYMMMLEWELSLCNLL